MNLGEDHVTGVAEEVITEAGQRSLIEDASCLVESGIVEAEAPEHGIFWRSDVIDPGVELVTLCADTPEELIAELEKLDAIGDPSPTRGGEQTPAASSPPSLSGKGAGGLGPSWPAFARWQGAHGGG